MGGVAGCAPSEPPAGVVAYPERSLSYAPLLLALKRGLYADVPVRLAASQLSAEGAVAAVVATGDALVGAMGMAEFIRSVAAGAPLVAIGALTSRLDCHLVTTTARPIPVATMRAIHLGEWRGLRVGVESGPDGTEAFVRMYAAWSDASRVPPQERLGPRAPMREIASSHAVDGETRWAAYETDEGLAAALADRRLEAFVGRAFAAAQTLSYGSGQLGRGLAEGRENHVLAALPTVLVTRRSGHAAAEEGLLRQLVRAVGRAADELIAHDGMRAAAVALPEKDSLHLRLAHGLMSPDATASAFAGGGRLGAEAVSRYVELAAMTGVRLDVNAGAATTVRFSG